MSLLSNDGQPNAGAPGDDLEAYAPAVRRSRGKKAPAEQPQAAAPAMKTAAKSEGPAQAFSGLRVSLMPSEVEGQAAPDLGRRLLILALVLIVETIGIGTGYFFVSRATDARIAARAELQAKIDSLDSEVAKQEDAAKEAAAYNGQVNAATEALDRHVYWTKFFKFLEDKTRPTTKYLNFSGDAETGTVTLDALSTSYRDAAEQIVSLREEPLIADVRTTAASAKISETGVVTGVSYTMVIKLKPETWTTAKKAAVPLK